MGFRDQLKADCLLPCDQILLTEDDNEDDVPGEEEVAGKPKDEGGEPRPQMTLDALMALVHLPIKKAAQHFGFGSPFTFKAALHQMGIKRWPYRQYACLRNLLAVLRGDINCYGFKEGERKGVIKQLKEEFAKLTLAPGDYTLPPNLKVISD